MISSSVGLREFATYVGGLSWVSPANYDAGVGRREDLSQYQLAACALTVTNAGQPARTFTSKHRAPFEILTDRRDHGVALVA